MPPILSSPLQEITLPGISAFRMFIKRDDLLHPRIQGNKWRKLMPLIRSFDGSPMPGVISFGGAFSNHLHALAHAGNEYGFPTVGIIRGLAVDLNNHTLTDARRCGMLLVPVAKREYELLKAAAYEDLIQAAGLNPDHRYHILPEGGDTAEALVGCSGLAVEIREQLPADAGKPLYLCTPAGTGCTAAGLMAGFERNARVLVFPAAPYGVDRESLMIKLKSAGLNPTGDFDVLRHLAPSKFARIGDETLAFTRNFLDQTGILLDPVYTVNMMSGILRLASERFFPDGCTVVAIHTGGLQGWSDEQLRALGC